jgi:V8-like Glu-specific endopeptidase
MEGSNVPVSSSSPPPSGAFMTLVGTGQVRVSGRPELGVQRRGRRRRRRRRALVRQVTMAFGLLVVLAGAGQVLAGGIPMGPLDQLVPMSAALASAGPGATVSPGRPTPTTAAPAMVTAAQAAPAVGTPSAAGANGGTERTARTVTGTDAGFVGALFPRGTGSPHSCTATVIAAPGHDLVLTAAHCVSGHASGVMFVPGYRDGTGPEGAWTVQAAYADPRWISGQDPMHDYAVLRVAPRTVGGGTQNLQDTVAGARLGPAPGDGQQVRVVAYDEGLDDRPIACSTATYQLQGYPAFDCGGFAVGSSGAPWLTTDDDGTPVVHGVIGGLHHGGCTPDTSYSSGFGADLQSLLARADQPGAGDNLPHAGSSGCPST